MAGHNFSNWMRGVLTADGFIREEIDAYDNATNPDGTPHYMSFYSETFRQMRQDRRAWCKERRLEGWNNEQIFETLFDDFQSSHGESPWRWLDRGYRPPRKADISAASRRRYAKRRRQAKRHIDHIAE